jgi:hypothetical protein
MQQKHANMKQYCTLQAAKWRLVRLFFLGWGGGLEVKASGVSPAEAGLFPASMSEEDRREMCYSCICTSRSMFAPCPDDSRFVGANLIHALNLHPRHLSSFLALLSNRFKIVIGHVVQSIC